MRDFYGNDRGSCIECYKRDRECPEYVNVCPDEVLCAYCGHCPASHPKKEDTLPSGEASEEPEQINASLFAETEHSRSPVASVVSASPEPPPSTSGTKRRRNSNEQPFSCDSNSQPPSKSTLVKVNESASQEDCALSSDNEDPLSTAPDKPLPKGSPKLRPDFETVIGSAFEELCKFKKIFCSEVPETKEHDHFGLGIAEELRGFHNPLYVSMAKMKIREVIHNFHKMAISSLCCNKSKQKQKSPPPFEASQASSKSSDPLTSQPRKSKKLDSEETSKKKQNSLDTFPSSVEPDLSELAVEDVKIEDEELEGFLEELPESALTFRPLTEFSKETSQQPPTPQSHNLNQPFQSTFPTKDPPKQTSFHGEKIHNLSTKPNVVNAKSVMVSASPVHPPGNVSSQHFLVSPMPTVSNTMTTTTMTTTSTSMVTSITETSRGVISHPKPSLISNQALARPQLTYPGIVDPARGLPHRYIEDNQVLPMDTSNDS